MTRNDLITQLEHYSSSYPEELAFIPRFKHLLQYENCFERSLLWGHITASAWVTTPDLQKVLLLHHSKLDRWLQPGGHADGDENVVSVAQKELQEETGLKSVQLATSGFFDLDIHTIPQRKDIPAHDHYDIRFHFVAHRPEETTINHESQGFKWVDMSHVLNLVQHEQSFVRMTAKTLTQK